MPKRGKCGLMLRWNLPRFYASNVIMMNVLQRVEQVDAWLGLCLLRPALLLCHTSKSDADPARRSLPPSCGTPIRRRARFRGGTRNGARIIPQSKIKNQKCGWGEGVVGTGAGWQEQRFRARIICKSSTSKNLPFYGKTWLVSAKMVCKPANENCSRMLYEHAFALIILT